jgi:hypothetical protein
MPENENAPSNPVVAWDELVATSRTLASDKRQRSRRG